MRNLLSIIILLYIAISGIAAKKPLQNTDCNNDRKTHINHLNDVKGFDFTYCRRYWAYSTLDSTYFDFTHHNPAIADKTNNEVELWSEPIPYHAVFRLTDEEKLKIYEVAKKIKFDLLPDTLELKNIYYFRTIFEQTISISFGIEKYTVTWDGIYPDVGENEYIHKYRKFVNRYNELNDTIYSILIKKAELHELYKKSGENENPIYFRGVTLKEIGFPEKYIPKIGRVIWVMTGT